MGRLIVAYDLGTSACKAAVLNPEGSILASHACEYETLFPGIGRHE